jgi:hypothetical protein
LRDLLSIYELFSGNKKRASPGKVMAKNEVYPGEASVKDPLQCTVKNEVYPGLLENLCRSRNKNEVYPG